MSEQARTITILRRPQVQSRTGLSRSSIYKRMGDGSFPKPVSLGGDRAVGWIESHIDDWLAKLSTKEAAR
jgi:prophage regulatory protein